MLKPRPQGRNPVQHRGSEIRAPASQGTLDGELCGSGLAGQVPSASAGVWPRDEENLGNPVVSVQEGDKDAPFTRSRGFVNVGITICR